MPRRSSYFDFKIIAVEYLRRHGNVKETAREFKVTPKMIREWRDNIDRLQQQTGVRGKKKRKVHEGRNIRSLGSAEPGRV